MLSHIAAIVWLKWKLWRNAPRGASATVNAGAAFVSVGVFLVLSLALGAFALSMGGAALSAPDGRYEWFLAKALFFLLAYWVLTPVLFSPDREIFDVTRFLPYPIAPRSLWTLHFFSTVFNFDVAWLYPALLAIAFLPAARLGLVGIPAALPVLSGAIAALVWRNVITTVLGGILKRRRMREVFILTISLLVILLQFYILTPNPNRRPGEGIARWFTEPPTGLWAAFLTWNPAGLAAQGANAALEGPLWLGVAATCALLGAAFLGASVGLRVLLRFYVEPPQEGGRVRRGKARMTGWRVPLLPDALVAILEKEVKYLFRSTAGKWAILSSLVAFLLFLGSPVKEGIGIGEAMDPVSLRAVGLGGFFLLMATRLCSNLFAWDGHGLKAYLLAPVPRAYILVGKGLAYGLLAAVQFALAFATLGFAYGRPTLDGLLGASAWYLSGLLVVVAAGTVFSVLLPQAESLQKFQRREQAIVGLLWFPLLGAAMAPGLGATILAGATGRPWLLPATMGGWCAILLAFYAVIVWWLSRELAQKGPDLLERITMQVT